MPTLNTCAIKNMLFYPITLCAQAYRLIVAGTGKIRAALLALKQSICTTSMPATHVLPPAPLLHFPAEILFEIMRKLDVCDKLAFLKTCTTVKNLYTYGQRRWLAVERDGLIFMRHSLPDVKSKLKAVYKEILFRLLDPETTHEDLAHTAGFAEKFFRHLSRSEIECVLDQVLNQLSRQQPFPGLQPQWEKLARVNFHLCVTLSGFATCEQFAASCGVTDWEFLSGRLATQRTQAEAFLSRMREVPAWFHNTALHHAADQKSIAVVSALLQANPGCVDIADQDGITALMLAAGEDDFAMVNILLAHGANMNLRDAYGNTALIYACKSGGMDVAELLLKHGTDIDLPGSNGWTVLMDACWYGEIAIVQLLLQYGAKTDIRDRDGQDVFALARGNGHNNIVQLLENHRQNPVTRFATA